MTNCVPPREAHTGDSPERMFPLLIRPWERRKFPHWPTAIPWRLIAPHKAQAWRNHGQTLERLAERGGLSPLEAACAIRSLPVPWMDDYREANEEAAAFINSLLNAAGDRP